MRPLLILLIFFVVPQITQAQYSGMSTNLNTAPALTTEPTYPSPGQEVTIAFDDFRGAMGAARLTWFYNGAAIKDAENQHTVKVTAPDAGNKATIKLVLDYNGLIESYTTTIAPLYLDLIIEPQTHVPGFYIGRALPSIGSHVKVTALLGNGKLLGNDYVYSWRINDVVFEGGPLRNVNKINFVMPQDRNSTLSLQVSTYNNVVVAKRTILLPLAAPELHFYEINSLFGLESRTLKDFNFIANSATIRTEPYYLDSEVFNNPSILGWKINGSPVASDGQNPYEVTLERTGEPGDATLDFRVRSTVELLQGVDGRVNINL